MKYYCPIKDQFDNTHSIDNLLLEYDIKMFGSECVDVVIDKIHEIRDRYADVVYWEKLNVNACSKYQMYKNVIHLDNGIFLWIGKYVQIFEVGRKKEKKYFEIPMLKMEFNPNKHAEKEILKDLADYLTSISDSCKLKRYDYAVDIPVIPDDVQVFGTRKEKGLYKGTRYFGQRNRNGYCRIYDKAKEQDLDTPLTRVEHTVNLVRTTKNLSFEKVYVKSNVKKENNNSKVIQTIVDLCISLKTNDMEYESLLDRLDRRTKMSDGELQSGVTAN